MDNFMDLVVYLIPIAIFVLSAIFGKDTKSKQKEGRVAKEIEHETLRKLLNDMEAKENRTMPDFFFEEPAVEHQPQPERQEPKSEIETLNEGEKAIIVENQEEPIETEPEEKPKFDVREAIIYSTIIEKKYC